MMQQENEATDVGVAETVRRLEKELRELRAEVARLDADLDESRRLNLRAAELLDMVYEHVSGSRRPADRGSGSL
jgi:molecular chaperone GrpE (heat shock protein)